MVVLDQQQLAKQSTVARLEKISNCLDKQFRLPGGIELGWDALVGLVPVVGDVAGFALSVWLIGEAKALGLSNWKVARMVANSLIDGLLGSIPLVGDIFDVFWQANQRNLNIILSELAKSSVPTEPSSG